MSAPLATSLRSRLFRPCAMTLAGAGGLPAAAPGSRASFAAAAAAAGSSSAPGGQPESWDGVLDVLSSLIKNKTRADGKSWRDAHENMPVYLQRLGIEQSVQRLSVIHVAGTKGKGSTCAMLERMLRSAGYSTGLFTSPHLCDVRERIRLNGEMVSKATFAASFWRVYRALQDAATPEVGMPGYFRFLTLLGLHVFLQAPPDVVILEVGIGGRIDATNILQAPVVTGITSLGYDHMELLGPTLDLIAREKAGIMRSSVPCFTVQQPPDAMRALEESAAAAGAPLLLAPPLGSFRHAQPGREVSVGLAGEHQQLNASLAVALARSWEQRTACCSGSGGGSAGPQQQQHAGAAGASGRLEQLQEGVLPAAYCEGLARASWPGRSQVVEHPRFAQSPPGGSSGGTSSNSGSRLAVYLDGAHTPESMLTCAAWFAHATQQQQQQQQQQRRTLRILLFNCMKERDPAALLPQLHGGLRQHGAPVDLALFVPPDSQYAFLPTSSTQAFVAAAHQDLGWQQQLRGVWEACEQQRRPEQGAPAAGEGGGGGGGGGSDASALSLLPPLPEVPGVGPQQLSSRAAVLSSVGQALGWLEEAAEARPELRLQVLVTGSLYLVGDCLVGLQQQPQ